MERKTKEIDLNPWYKKYRQQRKKEIEYLESIPYFGDKIRKNRERSREYNQTHKEDKREDSRRRREELTDSYIIEQLRKRNIPVTPETIEYKRIQLKLKREIKKQNNNT